MSEFVITLRADGTIQDTVKWYKAKLNMFAASSPGRPIDSFTALEIRTYIVTLRERERWPGQKRQGGKLSIESVRNHVRALKAFFKWCRAEYNIVDPMERIRIPRRAEQPVKAIALDDIQKMIKVAAEDESAFGVRNLAMILFLTDTGCRAAGICGLTLDRLDLASHRAIVIEKGDKQRAVAFTPTTSEFLSAWLEVRPLVKHKHVFCSLHNGRRYGEPLTTNGLSQMLERVAKKAGVEGRVNPHSFRHGFARQYLFNGGNLATLSRLLGHASSDVTTRFYAVFTFAEQAAAHDQFTPINNLAIPQKGGD